MVKQQKSIVILGIDTSCDDTCCAILNIKSQISNIEKIKVLSNVVSSQVKLHAKYGGVYPSLAKREHQRNLVPVLKKCLTEAKLLKISNTRTACHFESRKQREIKNLNHQDSSVASADLRMTTIKTLSQILERDDILRLKTIQFLKKYQKPKIDYIAITVGPGLEPCLWQGINFAKALSYYWNIPIIPVNHIEAHLAANWLSPISGNPKSEILNPKQIKFPAIGLVVSGGHTELILTKKIGNYKIIGETLDDAAGECFDKTARILGLPYPGGPAIAAAAAKLSIINYQLPNEKISLPRPMIHSKDFNFSFSGLKTAVLYNYKQQNIKTKKSKNYVQAMAQDIQQSIIDVLLKKTFRAAERFNVKTIILGGGVASNFNLRQQFKIQSEKLKINFSAPPNIFCLDNGAMVAIVGMFHKNRARLNQKLKADGNLKI